MVRSARPFLSSLQWTAVSAVNSSWATVAFGSTAPNGTAGGTGLLVAMARGRVMTSPDGVNWLPRNGSAVDSMSWSSVVWAAGVGTYAGCASGGFCTGQFVAFAVGGHDYCIATSHDGTTWTSAGLPYPSVHCGSWNGVAFGATAGSYGTFVAVGNGQVLTSPGRLLL